MNEEDEYDENDDSSDRCVILGGGVLGVELACAISGWTGLSEICLVFNGDHIYGDMKLWPEQFKNKLSQEIRKRGVNIKFYENCTIEKCVPSHDNPIALGSVLLTNGQEIECKFLCAAIGASPVGKDLFNKKSISVSPTQTIITDEHLALKSSENHNSVWVAGESSRGNCGVEQARESGKYCALAAFNSWSEKEAPPPFQFAPVRYSRLFEFLNNDAVIWYMVGEITPEMKYEFCGQKNELGTPAEEGNHSGPFACFYYLPDSDILQACLICGGNDHKAFIHSFRLQVESGSSKWKDAMQEFNSKFTSQ